MAVIGIQLATLRYDKIVASASWLAVQLGVSLETARQAIKTLVEIGWLSPAGRRGRANRFRLRPLETVELRERAWLHADTVEELAAGTADTPLAQVLLAASHPAIGYGDGALSTQLWVTWVHELAGVADDDTLGVSRRSRLALSRKARLDATIELLDRLDEEAARGVAFTRRASAEAEFKKQAAENAARLASVRAERAERYRRVRDARATIRAAVHSVGLPPSDRDAAQRWVPAIARTFSDAVRTPELLVELRLLVSSRGWTAPMADAAIRYLERDAA